MNGERKTPSQQPRHYDLDVWKDAMRPVREVYRITATFPASENYGLTTQMRHAAVSIPCNIAEGCGRGGRIELTRFMTVVRGSLAELDTQLWIARDLGLLSDPQATQDSIPLLLARLNALITSNRTSISKEPR